MLGINDGLCLRDGLSALGKLVGSSDQAFDSILSAVAQMKDVGRRVEVIVNIIPYLQKTEWLERLKRDSEELVDLSYRRRIMDAMARREIAPLTEHVAVKLSDTPCVVSERDAENNSSGSGHDMSNLKYNRYRVLSSSDRLEFIGDEAYARDALNRLFSNVQDRQLDNSTTLYGEPIRNDNKVTLEDQFDTFQKSADSSAAKGAAEAERAKLSDDDEYLLKRLKSIESLPQQNARRVEFAKCLESLAGDVVLIERAILGLEKVTDREFKLDASEMLEVGWQAALIAAQAKSVVMSTLRGAFTRKAPTHASPITLDDVKSMDGLQDYKHKVWCQERLIFTLCSIAKTLESGHRHRVMTEALREANVLRSLRGTILRYLSSLALIVPNLDGQRKERTLDEVVGLVTELIEWPGREETYFETPYCEALVNVAGHLDPSEKKRLLLKKALELTNEFPNERFKAEMIKWIAEEGAFDRELVKECLDQAQKMPEATLQAIPLSTIVISLDGMTARERWALLSERMNGTRRPELLFIIYYIAPAIKELGGDPALWRTANAINAVRGWIY